MNAFTQPAGPGIAARDEAMLRLLTIAILFGAALYQMMLCFVHTHLLPIRTAFVGAAEFALYAGCLVVMARRLRLEFVAVLAMVSAYLLFLALLRGSLDAKGFRDVLIVILFYWLGRTTGNVALADRLLKIMIAVVLAVGLFELLFLDLYSRIFNVFSYYVSQGGLANSTNWAKDSTLALNGMRPEGIGRTILPALLGNHRISSIFLEPVSFGNFAVIVAAWGLAKEKSEWRTMLFYLVSAMIMITLCDSRYGLVTISVLVVLRVVMIGRMHYLALLAPLACVLLLLGIALVFNNYYADNMLGRLRVTGTVLMNFGIAELFGLKGYDIGYGDMGYAVLLTRFGLPFLLIAWAALWLLRMRDDAGTRFRAYVAVYMSLILSISGTSMMALKTAGILWFLMGCLTLRETLARSAPHGERTSSFVQTRSMRYAN
ncbi:polysaccharide polymerase [uncultured Oxalicibacterium sp.]|uniref:polysaccharide polymerase n=1 Tax=uncultured Oxalicibacterium sp. TaxID=1168540 RepID=UPI0025E1BA3B|nr:polysaccharide polymerase [uncultured Oxalicibacterium sp.]